MSEEIYISVVTPVYQKEKFLSKCIDSILGQDYPFYEVILVDDGSLDNSGTICDEYAKINNNVRVFHKSNTGVSDTRNYGILQAKYDYIAFIDSDDYWDRHFLSEIVRLIHKYPHCGMYSTGFYKVDHKYTVANQSGITGDCIVENYFKQSLFYTIVNSSNVVVKKNLLLEIKGFPVGMIDAEDLCTWAKLASISKCAYSDRKLSYYNISANGWMSRKRKKDVDGYSFVELLNSNDDYYKKEYLSKLAYKKAIRYLTDGFKEDADFQIKPFLNSRVFFISMLKYRFYKLLPTSIFLRCIKIDYFLK